MQSATESSALEREVPFPTRVPSESDRPSRSRREDEPENLADQDAQQPTTQIRRAAELGDSTAQRLLGDIYLRVGGESEDFELALRWYRRAARGGDLVAAHNVGCMYAEGLRVTQNLTEAKKWLRKAAIAGRSRAQCNLGMIYLEDSGAQGQEKAAKWITAAVNQRDALAQCRIGLMHALGQGNLEPDQGEAVTWVRKSAKQGCAHGQLCLGIFYFEGIGIHWDYKKARKWYR